MRRRLGQCVRQYACEWGDSQRLQQKMQNSTGTIMTASPEQCRLQHLKHGRGQLGQGCYDAAAIREKPADGIGLDADTVDFHAQTFRLAENVFAGRNGIGHAIGQDEGDLPILYLRMQGLQHPPEGRGQGRAAGSGYAEVLRNFLSVTDQREDGRPWAESWKHCHSGVDSPDAFKGSSDGETGLPGQFYGAVSHAAAAIQKDVHGGIQARLDGFPPKHSWTSHTQTVQACRMQFPAPSDGTTP